MLGMFYFIVTAKPPNVTIAIPITPIAIPIANHLNHGLLYVSTSIARLGR
jgi:hypothetical protein